LSDFYEDDDIPAFFLIYHLGLSGFLMKKRAKNQGSHFNCICAFRIRPGRSHAFAAYAAMVGEGKIFKCRGNGEDDD